jgi:hypothetical protein
MIRIAIILLIASAIFSPAYALATDQLSDPGYGALDRANWDSASETFYPPAGQRRQRDATITPPLFSDAVRVSTESVATAPVPVPLPPSIWLFVAALATGMTLIRRRKDQP